MRPPLFISRQFATRMPPMGRPDRPTRRRAFASPSSSSLHSPPPAFATHSNDHLDNLYPMGYIHVHGSTGNREFFQMARQTERHPGTRQNFGSDRPAVTRQPRRCGACGRRRIGDAHPLRLRFRVYFVQRGDTLIVLLAGGDKSTQGSDIKTALALAEETKKTGA